MRDTKLKHLIIVYSLDLQPFTQYTLRIQACTSSGCGTSDSTQTRTLESTPEGIASPTLISRTSTSITIQLSPVTSPNGVVAYTLYIVGVFNDSIGSETRIAFTGDSTGMVVVESLVPFNDYRLFLDANNTVGGIRSESVTVQTLGTGMFMYFLIYFKIFFSSYLKEAICLRNFNSEFNLDFLYLLLISHFPI